MKRILAIALAAVLLLGALPAAPAAAADGDVVLANQQGTAPIYIDRDGADYDGLSLIAMAVAEDFGAITGKEQSLHHHVSW